MRGKGGGELEVGCPTCNVKKKVDTKSFFVPGGMRCDSCRGKMETVPQNKPKTHRSSKERHSGRGAAKAPAETDFKHKDGKNKRR